MAKQYNATDRIWVAPRNFRAGSNAGNAYAIAANGMSVGEYVARRMAHDPTAKPYRSLNWLSRVGAFTISATAPKGAAGKVAKPAKLADFEPNARPCFGTKPAQADTKPAKSGKASKVAGKAKAKPAKPAKPAKSGKAKLASGAAADLL